LDAGFPTPNSVFDDTTNFNSSNGVFNHDSKAGLVFVGLFLIRTQFVATGLLFGLNDLDANRLMALKARILMQSQPSRPLSHFLITDGFVMNRSGIGLTQVENPKGGRTKDIVFYRMLFFFPE
jgi:hypothetical protein